MKIEHRLNFFGFLEQALEEFESTSFKREYYRLQGYDYSEADFERFEIFTPPNLQDYLNQISFRSVIQPLTTISNILDEISDHKEELYFALIKESFTNNKSVSDYIPDTKNYSKLDEDEKFEFWYNQIVKIGSYCDYYPHRRYGLEPINALKYEPANSVEAQDFQNSDLSSIMTIRDIIFVSYLFDESVVINGRVPNTFELSCRKILKDIFSKHYPSQIVEYNALFVGFIDSIQRIVDEKLEILIRRKERSIYTDEWGEKTFEQWDRDLKAFSKKVVLSRVFFPPFVLYLGINSLMYDYINIRIQTDLKDIEHIVINYDLCSDFSELLHRISRASGKALEDMQVDVISAIINFLVSVRQDELQKSGRIKHSFSTKKFEDSESNQNISKHENGIDFEQNMRIKLETIGFSVMLTPITGDQGVDIIATRDGKRYAIQCKSYAGQVGNAAVQEVIAGKIFYDCDYACVITNSNFTPSAYQLAAKAGVIMCANENLEALK
jgi:HJR/Mrr/RecB family endonuclease